MHHAQILNYPTKDNNAAYRSQRSGSSSCWLCGNWSEHKFTAVGSPEGCTGPVQLHMSVDGRPGECTHIHNNDEQSITTAIKHTSSKTCKKSRRPVTHIYTSRFCTSLPVNYLVSDQIALKPFLKLVLAKSADNLTSNPHVHRAKLERKRKASICPCTNPPTQFLARQGMAKLGIHKLC